MTTITLEDLTKLKATLKRSIKVPRHLCSEAQIALEDAAPALIAAAEERDSQKSRADNHAETLRGIAKMNPETEGSRMALWARDGLSGAVEPIEATLLNLSNERNELKCRAEKAEAERGTLAKRLEAHILHEGALAEANAVLGAVCRGDSEAVARVIEERDRLGGQIAALEQKVILLSASLRQADARVAELEMALRAVAPHHQGGHSECGQIIAEALGIPFPIRSEPAPAMSVDGICESCGRKFGQEAEVPCSVCHGKPKKMEQQP